MPKELTNRSRGLHLVMALCVGMSVGALAAELPTLADDAAAGRKLYESGNFVGALPVYERLAQRDPQDPLFAERLAYTLVAQFTAMPAGEQRKALVARATAEAQRAKALGDNSNLLQMLLGYLQGGTAEVPGNEERELAAAEAAFVRGEYDKALAIYEAVAAANPMSYGARLFAGDVHFIKGNVGSASRWFQDAIDINPNIETAHRYWGDVLAKAGRDDEALPHYINAVIAEPYNRKSWAGLQQWADRGRVKLRRPIVNVPAAPTVAQAGDGKVNVTLNVDADKLKNPRTGPAWLLYSLIRGTWMRGEFVKQFPQEQKYRHSLAEEAMALRTMLGTVKVDQLDLIDADKDMRDLVMLGSADMIEPFVLLHAADEGIAQDYAAYRAAHHDKLVAYIQQFMIAAK